MVVIDQFEEMFTLCHDLHERARFVVNLMALVERHRVVIGLRSDFVAHCSDYPQLREVLSANQVLVGAMTAEELRQAVVEPAERAGCVVESELVAAIVADAAGRAAVLPMVSHALLETWRRRQGSVLTLAGYRAAGGIEGALAQTAEERYSAMDPTRQRLARDLLVRMTALGEGAQDTRRRISRDELDSDDTELSDVVATFADARLLTLDESTVELTHEALITAWPRLHRWLLTDRDDLRTHRRLTEAVRTWIALGRDRGALYRGAQLMIAKEWAARADHRRGLNPAERAFLDASIDLEADERRLETRKTRQLRWLTAGVVVLLMIVTAITVIAIDQRQEAVAAREVAISRQLAVQALALTDSRPETAMLLSAKAFRVAPTVEARGAVLSMSARTAYRSEFHAHERAVSELAFFPDGRILATVGEDHTIGVWDTQDHRQVARISEHDTWLHALAISPDGAMLASGGEDHAAVIWHAQSHVRMATLKGHTGTVKEAAFSQDGRLLATAGADDTVMIWNVAQRTIVARLTGHGGEVNTVAFSRDGRTLAAAGSGQVVVEWDVASGTRIRTRTGHTDMIHKVVYSPTGLLASAGRDSSVRIWRPDAPATVLTGHEGSVIGLAFSSDGQTLASAGNDTVIRLWDVRYEILRARLTGHTTSVYSLAFGAGATLAAAGENGTVTLWDTDRAPLANHAPQNDLAFSPDGTVLAVAAGNHMTLWDRARRTRRADLAADSIILSIAFAPNGATIATAHQDGSTTLWSTDGARIARLTGHTGEVLDVAISPDGRTLVTGGVDQTANVWDLASRTRRTTLNSQAGPINGVTFSLDGSTLVTTSHDTTIVRWRTTDWTPLDRFTGHTGWVRGAVFSPDGATLATAATDSTVRLWRPPSTTPIATLPGHVDAQMIGIAYSPDGTTLAYTSAENTITLWRTDTNTAIARLRGFTKPVRAVAFSPDGTAVTAVGENDAVLLWDTDAERVVDRICAQVARDLTDDERREFVPEEVGPSAC